MTTTLKSFVSGAWMEGSGDHAVLVNPTTEAAIAKTSTTGVDFAAAAAYARDTGGPALRELTFAARGKLLTAMSKAIHEHREELLDLATENGGNTRGDAKFDVDGATGTLSYYGKLGEGLGEQHLLADGDSDQLTRSKRFFGRHVYGPRAGVAVLINAFNFPAWGFAEKAAAAILAGMPVINKPATSTALVAYRIAEILVDKKVLPDGAFSFIAGSTGDLLDHLSWQDVVAFTGSSDTGLIIRSNGNILKAGVRVNVEADSLNAAVLDPSVDRDAETYDLFLREVVRDVTQKAGQKCTAIRRIFVTRHQLDYVRDGLAEQLGNIKTGDPSLREVEVGPVATADQLRAIGAELDGLMKHAKLVVGDGGRGTLTGVDGDKGYFVSPTLLEAENADAASPVHSREIFGPVATLMTYDGTTSEAISLLAQGGGSLVSSIYGDDSEFTRTMVEGATPYLGRIHLGSKKVAEHSPGPGTALPMMSHGGPGRAGGGEELGGLRGLHLYMQRTAVQGYAPLLDKLA